MTKKPSLKERAVNAIIRPPRKEYDLDALPLFLEEGGKRFIRHPLTLNNERGQKIVGSIYHSLDVDFTKGGPCVMYLHGNASSQLEAQFLVPNLCPYGIFVFAFDFVGCGNSDGKYVSLGWYESQDTDFLITTLNHTFFLQPFILWGRSMGAATSILVKHPLVVAKVVDSSFTSLPDMCTAIGCSMGLPSAFAPAVIAYLKSCVFKEADFDIKSVSPLSSINDNPVPIVFGHAEKDQFIPFEQCRTLFDAYPNPMKFLSILDGGHNSRRDYDWIKLGVSFILVQFSIDAKDLVISECRTLQSADFHFQSFGDMVASVSSTDDISIPTTEEVIANFNEQEQKKKRPKIPKIPKTGSDDESKRHKKHKKHHHRKRINSESVLSVKPQENPDSNSEPASLSVFDSNTDNDTNEDVFDNDNDNDNTHEDSNESANENTHEDSNESANENTHEDSNENTNENTHEDSHENTNENTHEDIHKDSNESTNENTHEDSNENTNENTHKDSNESTNNNIPESTNETTHEKTRRKKHKRRHEKKHKKSNKSTHEDTLNKANGVINDDIFSATVIISDMDGYSDSDSDIYIEDD